jgi:hypothetical protein
MRIWPWCRRLLVVDGGSEIAEAALVLPIVLTLLLAIIFFGRAYNIYTTLTYAAHEGARMANTSTCATCGNNAGTAAQVSATVAQVLQASKINPTAIQTYAGPATPVSCAGGGASCSDSGGVHVCTNVQIGTAVAGVSSCGSTVSFQYPYHMSLPLLPLDLQLKADAQLVSDN